MTSKILRSNNTQMTGIKSVIYKEVVNAGEGLRPGCVASASIEVEVYGPQSDAPVAGEALTYYQVDGTETLIGTFYAEPSIPTKKTYKFVAYDAVSKLDVGFSERLNAIQSWFESTSAHYPVTVYDLVSEACSVAGVTLGSASWPLSTQTVEAFYADGLTCRNILQYAAEIAGKFVRCNANGGVVFDWYTTSSYSIKPGVDTNAVAYKQDGLSYDNYAVLSVDAVAVRPQGTEGAAYIYPASYSAVTATDPNGDGNIIFQNLTVTDDGDGNLYLSVEATDDGNANVTISSTVAVSNTFVIGDNLLLTNATANIYNAVAQNLYSVMSALPNYRHATVNLFKNENPFRAGQFVSITDAQGVTFNAPIFEMTVQADGATLRSSGEETYKSTGPTVEKTLANLSSNIVQIDKLKVGWAEIDEAIVRHLEAEGIDADWINTGSITVTDANGNIIFKADIESKSVQFGGSTASNGEINGGVLRGARVISERTTASGYTLKIEMYGGGLYAENFDDMNAVTTKFYFGGETTPDRLQFTDDLSGTETDTSHYGSRDAHVEGDLSVSGLFSAKCVNSTGDADNMFTPGLYHMASGATNIPEGINGLLIVFQLTATNYKQVFQRLGTPGTNDNCIYTRTYGGGAWGHWWKFTGTAV